MPFHDREGSVVAITREGRRAVGADGGGDVRVGATRGSGLRHARAVSWVTALLTLRGREWVSDHEARGLPAWHVPVGRFLREGAIVAGLLAVAAVVETYAVPLP